MSPTSAPGDPAPITIGFDIGGTNLRGAAVDADGRILATEHLPTPSGAQAMDDAIARIVDSLARRHDIAAVGLAVAGFLDPDCTRVRFAPHLPWRDANVHQQLEKLLGLPVRLEHDANSAAWGEYRFGAAKDARIWALFAVGTGIGGALMIDGTLFRGSFGTAPEFGHIAVVPHGRACPCGKRGCLERYCSGTALADTARELIASREFPGSCLVASHLDSPDAITGRVVVDCARNNDPAALAVIDDFARWMGQGLAMVADIIDPELIVIGGGVAQAADLYLDAATRHFHERITGTHHRPHARLETAKLRGDAGMIGVADLARQQLADPAHG